MRKAGLPAAVSNTAGTFTWPNGDNSPRTFVVSLTNNFATNANKTVNLRLSGPTGGATAGIMNAVLTIVDDDSLVGFSANAYSVVENSGTATITLVRSGATNLPVTVTFTTADGTAIAGTDYTNATTSVTFAPGQTTTNLLIGITDNVTTNLDKTVLLNLTAAVSLANPVVLDNTLVPTNAVLTIVDNDVYVQFLTNAFGVMENAGSAVITAVRYGVTNTAVSVNYATANGTALDGLHYTGQNGVLTFAPGVTTQTFTVPIIDDVVTNVNRTVNLALAPATQFYFNDFESGSIGSEWTIINGMPSAFAGGYVSPTNLNVSVTPRGSRHFLGEFANNRVTLTLTNLPAHTNLTVSFDLYLPRSWDGNGIRILSQTQGQGPDVFDLSVAGVTNLLHTTFANTLVSSGTAADQVENQAYPNAYPGGDVPAFTGATEMNTLGYIYSASGSTQAMDSVYHLTYTFAHVAGTVAIQFTATNLQNITNESWGLDNVSVVGGGTQLGAPVPNNLYLGSYSNATLTITNDDVVDLVAGTADPLFSRGFGANGPVYSLAFSSNNAVMVGGNFSTLNSARVASLARVFTNGLVDSTFNPGTGPNAAVYAVATQPLYTNAVVIGGAFTSYNGTSRSYFARVFANGTVDPTYVPGAGFNAPVRALAVQGDNSVLVGGDFTQVDGQSYNRLVLIDTNGNVDATFNVGTGANGTIRAIAVESDGSILVGGDFTTFNGLSLPRIARLNFDGSIDNTFHPGLGADASVTSIQVQTNGAILVG
ncbi:MAG: hypothetical protein EBY09_15720, partial [Verrucomicrobia bacterium]|nr:hypothetical protein [Verrucomicrobiota bacterium]